MLYSLLSSGSTKEDRNASRHYWKIVDWDVKRDYKQTRKRLETLCEKIWT